MVFIMNVDPKKKRKIEVIDAFIEESYKDKFKFGDLRNGISLAFFTLPGTSAF
jgi:hypothetical protein